MNTASLLVQPLPAVDGAAAPLGPEAAVAQVWQRLAPRLARSAGLARRQVTVRAADMPCQLAPDGVRVRTAYDTSDGAALPGEPTRIRLIDLPAGVRIELAVDPGADSAWLVIDGRVDIGGVPCGALGYQQRRAGEGTVALTTGPGARLMLRESQPDALGPLDLGSAGAVRTTRAGLMGWEALAEGISRRLLAPPSGASGAYLVRKIGRAHV